VAKPPASAALARMRAGEASLGLIVRLARSGEIAHMARASGHDFLS
jgi:staphyloferrin B biosynthesis citrate synthase